jgi:hypothetical protein
MRVTICDVDGGALQSMSNASAANPHQNNSYFKILTVMHADSQLFLPLAECECNKSGAPIIIQRSKRRISKSVICEGRHSRMCKPRKAKKYDFGTDILFCFET